MEQAKDMPALIDQHSNKTEKLEARAKKLAMEKSYLQLIINMMENLNRALDMNETVISIPRIILNNIGGTNVILYYFENNKFYGVDAYEKKWEADPSEDELLHKVIESKEHELIEKEFKETMMKTAEFTKGWTWIYPLIVADELIGVVKMENLHIGMESWKKALPTFFNFAALLLKNSIMSHSRLKKALDELKIQNEKLETFNSVLVDREMRVVEVKMEVNALCKELGKEARYKKIDEILE